MHGPELHGVLHLIDTHSYDVSMDAGQASDFGNVFHARRVALSCDVKRVFTARS